MEASLFLITTILFSVSLAAVAAASDSTIDKFLQCLPNHINSSNPSFETIYKPNNSSFQSTLQAYAKNLRLLTPKTPKPLAILAPTHESHVQATVICAKSHGLQIRIRSGGHDFEGISYRSEVPFIILDMFNFRGIDINVDTDIAWVQAGATLGELYYKIANQSTVHAFPAGVCPTIGTGGHFSGGGYGNLMRKFGLSIDNILDAQIVDSNGRILYRDSMGEDLFWAIRGGGGASFAVILKWKIRLVRVPELVTVFNVGRKLEEGATDIVYKWQQVAHKLDRDLFIRVMPQIVNGSSQGEKKVEIFFIGMFLGNINRLLPLINKSFPELGLQRNDCKEVRWIESTLFWAEFPNGTSIDVLLQRPNKTLFFTKSKSDYVKEIIPKSGLEALWKMMLQVKMMWVQFNPYGGRMDEISESESPFPHRAGYKFLIQYSSNWKQSDGIEIEKQVNLLGTLYNSMAPYVSKEPRETFLCYRDLDIGRNPSNFTDFQKAEVYGRKYFKNNFLRLVEVKTRVDPDNFFRHEQSIPTKYKLM